MVRKILIFLSLIMLSNTTLSIPCNSTSIRNTLAQAGDQIAKIELLNRISRGLSKLKENLKARYNSLKNRSPSELSVEEIEAFEAEVETVQEATYVADAFYFEAEASAVTPPAILEATVVNTQNTINEAKIFAPDKLVEPQIDSDFIIAPPVSASRRNDVERQIAMMDGAPRPTQAGRNYKSSDIIKGYQRIDTRNLPGYVRNQNPEKPIFVGYHGTDRANAVLSEGYKTKRADINNSALHWGPGIYTTMDYEMARKIGKGTVLEVWVLPSEIQPAKQLSVGEMPNNVKYRERTIFDQNTPQSQLNIAENDITVGPFTNFYEGIQYRVSNQAKVHPRLMEEGRVFFQRAK